MAAASSSSSSAVAVAAAASPTPQSADIRTALLTAKYHLEVVSPLTVKELDKDRFNTNNHWVGGVRPADYDEVLAQGQTHRWIDDFKRHYTVLNIDAKEMRWMRKAEVIGHTTGRFSAMYSDERDSLVSSHMADCGAVFEAGTSYFVRTENVSLKYGMHGVGPYKGLKESVESLVTSTAGHSPLSANASSDGDTSVEEHPRPLKLYLIPWQPMSKDREFRVFVCENRVTCVSQQYLYQTNKLLAGLSEDARHELIVSWLDRIVTFHAEVLVPKLRHISSYSMDLSVLDDGRLYFIEPNCFGAEYAAGSSLFHWIHDREQLYGLTDRVHFRWVMDESVPQ
jgi:hypothetical protein